MLVTYSRPTPVTTVRLSLAIAISDNPIFRAATVSMLYTKGWYFAHVWGGHKTRETVRGSACRV
jgi:hypothetical protein